MFFGGHRLSAFVLNLADDFLSAETRAEKRRAAVRRMEGEFRRGSRGYDPVHGQGERGGLRVLEAVRH